MGFAKVAQLTVIGAFVVLIGIFGYGLWLKDDDRDQGREIMRIASILMMVLGSVAVFMAVCIWALWMRNRLVSYSTMN